MDPKQTLLDARNALLANNRTKARRIACEYYAWRNRGGFVPTFTATGRTHFDGSPYTISGNDWAIAIVSAASRKLKNPSDEVPAFLTFEVN